VKTIRCQAFANDAPVFAGMRPFQFGLRRRGRVDLRFFHRKTRGVKTGANSSAAMANAATAEFTRVLTEKKGVFWGCFAEKRGSGLNYLTLYFAFSPVFGTLGFSKPLRLKGNRRTEASKINRA
jgi:hypothetical protein